MSIGSLSNQSIEQATASTCASLSSVSLAQKDDIYSGLGESTSDIGKVKANGDRVQDHQDIVDHHKGKRDEQGDSLHEGETGVRGRGAAETMPSKEGMHLESTSLSPQSEVASPRLHSQEQECNTHHK